jgi:hypothetical protein
LIPFTLIYVDIKQVLIKQLSIGEGVVKVGTMKKYSSKGE